MATLSHLGEARWTRTDGASSVVQVLDADPDLGAAIPKAQWTLAAAASLASAFACERGPWRFSPRPDPGGFGALLLEGLIVIRSHAETRSHLELLGSGDVISPWVGTGQELTLPSILTASVVSHARIALLDRRFVLRTARWPEIHAALMQRLIVRARRLSGEPLPPLASLDAGTSARLEASGVGATEGSTQPLTPQAATWRGFIPAISPSIRRWPSNCAGSTAAAFPTRSRPAFRLSPPPPRLCSAN